MKRCIPLEAAAETVCNQSAQPPLIFQLPPSQGRNVLEEAQNTPVYMYPADIFVQKVHAGTWGTISVSLVLPQCSEPIRNIIFYIHGGGWVFGSFHTHEKLVRELAVRTNSLVIFPEYTLSPEAKYPMAIEQCYFVLSHLEMILKNCFGNTSQQFLHCPLTVAGDSVGGNMAIAMVLLSEQRNDPKIDALLLYYPVTNACFHTPSYQEFANNYYLYRIQMQWFWRQYISCEADRSEITASPLRANLSCLEHFPPTMIINGQADVLRSEGQTFAEKLLCAGVDVTALQIQGTIHDFVMLNALDQTNACRAAMNASVDWLNQKCF